MPKNRRETGARKLPTSANAGHSSEVSQDAAENRKPPNGQGNSEPVNETNDKTRHSDGKVVSGT